MKKSLFILLLAVLGLAATGCSTTFKSMEKASVYFELGSSDYILSDQVSGEATVTRVLNVDWMRLLNNQLGNFKAPVVGLNLHMTDPIMYAMYDLMEKNPGYDFVFYPQVTTKTEGVTGLYTVTNVKITARLGKLKR